MARPRIRKSLNPGTATKSGRPKSASARLAVKVTPRASRNEVVGWMDDRLKLRIAAPPQDGRANEALEVFLADELGIARRRVRVAVGHTSTSKIVEFDGLEQADLIGKWV